VDKTLGKNVNVTFTAEERNLLTSIGILAENVIVYSRARIKGEIFTSQCYKSIRTANYIIKCIMPNNSVLYGSIRFFVTDLTTIFCIIDPYSINHTKILFHIETRAKFNHIIPIKPGGPPLILRITDLHYISKILQIDDYICIIPKSLKKNML